MQSAFFYLTNIIPHDEAKDFMKKYAEKAYRRKGQDVVEPKFHIIDKGIEGLEEIFVDPEWKYLPVDEKNRRYGQDGVRRIAIPSMNCVRMICPCQPLLVMRTGLLTTG